MTEPSRWHEHTGKILFIACVLLFAGVLALCEWWLTPSDGRYTGDARSSGGGPARYLVLREWKANTNYLVAPPPERKLYAGGEIPSAYLLATDGQGFIEPSRVHAAPGLTIVFLGGSTTESLYVKPENRFPHLAARNLEKLLGIKVNGFNGARSGNNAMHSLLLTLGKVLPLKPDFVVLMHAVNDLGVLAPGDGYWTVENGRKLIRNEKFTVEEAIRTAIKATIPHTSRKLGRGWRRLTRIPAGSQPEPPPLSSEPAQGTTPNIPGGQDFARALTSFAETVKAWGITPVLMTQAYVPPASEAEKKAHFLHRERLPGNIKNVREFHIAHGTYNEITRQVARATGAMLIDLSAARRWRYGEVYDGIHLTDAGSQIAAGLIADALAGHARARLGR